MTWRNVLGMLILVALCGAALWFVQDIEDDGPEIPTSLLALFDKRDVTRMRIGGADVELVVRRRPDASDSWDVQVGDEWARADAVQVDEILLSLTSATVSDAFPPEGDGAEYGLTDPSVTLTLTLPGGERTARFGQRTREGSSVYADRGPGTDVMIVSVTPQDELGRALNQGIRDRRVSDLRTYDLRRVEIEQRGRVTLDAEKDLTQIWRIRAPFEGYADPTAFETRLSYIVNEQWKHAVAEGARDLPRYGLHEPVATVTLTSKREIVRTILIGAPVGPEAPERYAKEEGYGTVFVVSERFVNAVMEPAEETRDRSFARLGLGVQEVTVRLPEATYVLTKAHTEWEIEKPVREPAEGKAVNELLEKIRQWHVVEFLDDEDPAAHGVSPDGPQIQVESDGGALTTFLIGDERADGHVYAQRKEDGGLAAVMVGPLEQARRGWLQFKRLSAIELNERDIDFIARDKGFGVEAEGVTDEKWRRDLGAADTTWKPEIGQTGAGLDSTALERMLATLRSIRPVEWVRWAPSRNEELGFRDGGGAAATAWLEIDFRPEANRNPVYVLIGKAHGDQGERYARIQGQDHAFRMSAEDVERLTAPLMRR